MKGLEAMNILIICNNYDSMRDGIGKYAKLLSDAFEESGFIEEVLCSTGYTDDSSITKMLFSFQMSQALVRALSLLEKKKIDIVLFEYPFQEYNPLIIWLYQLLKNKCKKKAAKLVLSIHEYRRANTLRKKVVDFMAKRADLTLVSDLISQSELLKKSNTIYLRNMIGNIFPMCEPEFEMKKDDFLYFGLVNRSKAFKEMLDAWHIFNKDKKKKLTIITSTELKPDLLTEGIEIKSNLPEKEVGEYMSSSRYMILPILPEIATVNGTFKTAALFGCICIGHFSEELKTKRFIVETECYEADKLAAGFKKAYELGKEEKQEMFYKARSYGEIFTPQAAVQELMELFRQKLKIKL